MIPDPDLQLSVAIKALRDVVAPAVNPADAVAVEQLHLALATLSMVRSRLPFIHAVARQELANALLLAAAVDTQGRIGELIAQGREMLENPAITTAEIDVIRGSLLDAVSNHIVSISDPDRQKSIAKAVIAHSRPQCDLARAWSLPAGFEPDPDEIMAIERLL